MPLPPSQDRLHDTSGALPVYLQIAERLTRQIGAGHLADGARLPPERDLARSHGVAVGTLRKALARLADQGLLDRRHGSGNYVRARTDTGAIYAFFRLELLSGGGLPRARLLALDHLRAPADAPVPWAGAPAHRFRRLRMLDDTPVALEEIWLNGALADGIEPGAVSQSLYHYYRESLGLWIARAEDRVGVDAVPEWNVDQFALDAGAPSGFVERIGWTQTGQPAEYSRTWFDPARARYVARQG